MKNQKNKYALIGKNIQHSKSPEMYKKLLGHEVDYTFLDYESEKKIPPLNELLEKYCRISVTAPYKNYVFRHCDILSEQAQALEAVNAIKLKNAEVIGTNTDALAFEEIFSSKYLGTYPIILGDGAMSRLAQQYFKKTGVEHIVLSRKRKNLEQIDQYLHELSDRSLLIINACGRSYNFDFKSHKPLKVWDLNYSMPEQQNYVLKSGHEYTDGEDLLIRQAEYALSFWNS